MLAYVGVTQVERGARFRSQAREMLCSSSIRCLGETMRGEPEVDLTVGFQIPANLIFSGLTSVGDWLRYLPMLVQHDLLQTLIALLQEPAVVRLPGVPSASLLQA